MLSRKIPLPSSNSNYCREFRSFRRTMMHRWGRAPLSCRPCREKKRRCDRQRPCSSCTLRSIDCRYADDDTSSQTIGQRPQDIYSHTIYPSPAVTSTETRYDSPAPWIAYVASIVVGSLTSGSPSEEVLRRLQRLEEAVFNKPDQRKVLPETGELNSGGLLEGKKVALASYWCYCMTNEH